MTTQTISVRVDSNVLEAVKKIAKLNGLSLSSVINVKLREFANNKELRLVDDEIFDISFGKKGVPAQEILDYLKSLN
ncbi:MAG: BrnA antitoxin family protein [Candidatus Absconditabacterales bacterium]|nr:BrnA antitoxin family protein [Candidatus Absconditabacterales bacterium]